METTRPTGPIAVGALARWPGHPISGIPLHPISFVPVQPSLPVAESRNGSLFADRFDSNLHWYLPDFALAGDVDPAFAFAVSQKGQQANGQPLDVAKLSLALTKQQPASVAQFAQANPRAVLREIPLENLTAILTSSYLDQNGNSQQQTFKASSLTDQNNGIFLLVFDDSILGQSVLAVYQDLRTFGKAAIVVNATYNGWSQSPPRLTFSAAMFSVPVQRTILTAPHTISLARVAAPVPTRTMTPTPAPAPANWVQITSSYSENLALTRKYNASDYQLRYTIQGANPPSRVIIDSSDLSSFNQRQTQFTQFEELGDLNLKYPSLSGAYVGSASHTIVLIPQRYSIVRGKSGCSATCLARVDSSPSSTSQCEFEFDFVIAPEISAIDMAKLALEIAAHPDLSGYQITLADFLQTTPSSTLQTSFASTVQFAAGADPHTFAVTVTVQDAGPNSPAVADANLFIQRLCAQFGTDLIGSLSLKLDDGYPTPVLAAIDLNFAHTAASDELLPQIDENAGAITVTNQSSHLDLWIQRYALIQGVNLDEFDTPTLISAGGSVSFPLPANSAGSTFAYEGQLALPPSMDTSAITKFLSIQTADVQNTQYVVALDASGIDFAKVASVVCVVTLPTLPSIAPWQTTLTANLKADSRHIQIPIANAIFTLPGTVNLTINATDPATAPVNLSLQNDFTANPVMTLLQSQLVGPPTPAPASTSTSASASTSTPSRAPTQPAGP